MHFRMLMRKLNVIIAFQNVVLDFNGRILFIVMSLSFAFSLSLYMYIYMFRGRESISTNCDFVVVSFQKQEFQTRTTALVLCNG